MTEHEANVKLAAVRDGRFLHGLLVEGSVLRSSGVLRTSQNPSRLTEWRISWEPVDEILAPIVFEPYESSDEIASQIARYQYSRYRELRRKLEATLRGLAGLQSPQRLPEIDAYRLDDYFIEIIDRSPRGTPRGDFALVIRQHDGRTHDNGRIYDVSDWSMTEIFAKIDP